MITVVDQEGRTQAGLSTHQYNIIDIFDQLSKQEPLVDGWSNVTWTAIGEALSERKQAIIFHKYKLEENGFLEAHPDTPRLKRLTKKARAVLEQRDIKLRAYLEQNNFLQTTKTEEPC